MNNKEMRKKISDYIASVFGRMVTPAMYVSKVGYKYVTMVDLYHPSKDEIWPIQKFYDEFVPDGWK